MIDFHLNGEPQSLDGLPPDTSVLELLRTRLDATGTKEGGASGDCWWPFHLAARRKR